MRRFLGSFLVLVLSVFCFSLSGDGVSAQSGELLLTDDSCRLDPNSEDCICRNVARIQLVPRSPIDPGPPPFVDTTDDAFRIHPDHGDVTGSHPYPYWNSDIQAWEGHPYHLISIPTDKYKAYCAMEYFREDLRRLLYFLIALASGLVLISVAWAAVIHMMDSATGEQRSQARTIIVRTIVGLVLIAMLFVIYEQVSGLAVGTFDIWDSDVPFLQELQ